MAHPRVGSSICEQALSQGVLPSTSVLNMVCLLERV